jgi:serine/threonine protein phosphatase PrpC
MPAQGEPAVLADRVEGELVQIASSGLTDVGRVRTNNEDSFRVVEPLSLFILSDGMGGEAHGEIASAMAVETIAEYAAQPEHDSGAILHGDEPNNNWSPKTKRLKNAIHLANLKIYQSAQKNPEQRGMGATVTVVWVDSEKLSIAHVGDSRAYLLRSGTLQQLTNDHSLVAEQVRRGLITPQQAEESEMQSVLLRALGAHPDVEVDVDEVAVLPNDVLLLCSDGLTRMVTEPEIAGSLQAETNPASAAQKLIELANERGGLDNITVIVARFLDESPKGWLSWLRRGPSK